MKACLEEVKHKRKHRRSGRNELLNYALQIHDGKAECDMSTESVRVKATKQNGRRLTPRTKQALLLSWMHSCCLHVTNQHAMKDVANVAA